MRRRILEHLADGLIAKERLGAAYHRCIQCWLIGGINVISLNHLIQTLLIGIEPDSELGSLLGMLGIFEHDGGGPSPVAINVLTRLPLRHRCDVPLTRG